MFFRDVVIWIVIIFGCVYLGYEFEVFEFLKEMLGEGVEFNFFIYLLVLKVCVEL